MDINKILQSRFFKGFLFGIVGLLLLSFVFKVGEIVGAKKADFSCRWSDNYHRNFGGPKEGFFRGFGDKDFMEASGTFGQIIKIESSTSSDHPAVVVVRGRGDMEGIILVDKNTVIKNLRETIKLADLRIDQYMVTIGEPNDAGQIAAKLIRVLPQQPPMAPSPMAPFRR